MESTTRPEPDDGTLDQVEGLCDRTRYLQASALLGDSRAFPRWRSPRALCVAARLAQHLGAPELSKRLALTAHRRDPGFPQGLYWAGTVWLSSRGPLAASIWLDRKKPAAGVPPRAAAYVSWLRAAIVLSFRDFDAAARWLDEAEEQAPDDPYASTMRIGWLMAQDRYAEAHEAARAAVERYPDHRPSVEILAESLQIAGETERALETVLAPAQRLESGALHLRAAELQFELERFEDARLSVERAEKSLPLLEARGKQHLAARRSDIAYRLGDIEAAIRHGSEVDNPFFKELVERLRAASDPRRVLLDVGFVRQHHLTCVPATLATLGRFWEMPVDHLDVADRICFNGTRSYSERRWAEDNGFVTREFTLDWASARALLDRGVPFIVDTVQATSAHAQAVIGYDQRRGTLHIRDPFEPATLEFAATAFFEAFKAHGPRAFAMVPGDRAELLDGLDLPDRALYAKLDRVEQALEVHDRGRAVGTLDELRSELPGHRVTLLAERALAAYDQNAFELQRTTERALELYPGEPTFLTQLFLLMRDTATQPELVARLERVCEDEDAHPVFTEMLAAEYLCDSRRLQETRRLLRRVARQMPQRSRAVGLYAQAAWQSADFRVALSLFRFATCLEPTDDHWAEQYFRAALSQGQVDQALELLEQRAARFKSASALPTLTLFSALDALERTQEAFAVLDRALEARPDDGALWAFAAEARARVGELDAARQHLSRAEKLVSRTRFLRSGAIVEECAGEHEKALEMWRGVAEVEPLSVDAHDAVARRLAALYGNRHALAHVRAASDRFPGNPALLELKVRWMEDEEPGLVRDELLRLIELAPASAWAHRELALVLGRLRLIDEARAEAALGLELAPHQVSSHLVRARLAELEGDVAGAVEACEKALGLQPDSSLAISSLVESAVDARTVRRHLELIEQTVTRSSVTGEGVQAWYRHARRHLEAGELAEKLALLERARGDLWCVASCRVRHALEVVDADGAASTARAAVDRFPLVPALWLELARAEREAGRPDREIEAIERALAIQPGYAAAALALAFAFDRAADTPRSLAALDRGLRHNPLDEDLLLLRADLLWQTDRRKEALEAVRRAIAASPSSAGAWERVRDWSGQDADAAHVLDTIDRLCAARPWDARLLARLAEVQLESDPHRALETVERAIELDPAWTDAHDLHARVAALIGHRALAEAACRPAALEGHVPLALRGRAAWVCASFGDIPGAIARMKKLVAERPDYSWGWKELADWAEQSGDADLAVEAADALVRLEPRAPAAHGYRGAALVQADRKADARRAFRRALALAPDYAYALDCYMRLLVEAGKHGRARRELEQIAPHQSSPLVAHWRLRLALEQGEWKSVEEQTRALFAAADAPESALASTFSLLSSKGPTRLTDALEEIVWTPDAPAHVGRFWAANELPHFSTVRLHRLRRVNPLAAEAALVEIVNDLARRRYGLSVLWLVLTHLGLFRSSDDLWGTAGSAFVACRYYVFAVLWLWGYERRHPDAWMLQNLGVALRALGFSRVAVSVHRYALGLPPDSSRNVHLAMLALEAATTGNTIEASTLLDDVAKSRLSRHYSLVCELVAAMIELSNAPAGERRSLVNNAWFHLNALFPSRFSGCFRLDAIRWRRVARRIGRLGANPFDFVEGYWDTLLSLAIPCAAVFLVVEDASWFLFTLVIQIWLLLLVIRVMRRGKQVRR